MLLSFPWGSHLKYYSALVGTLASSWLGGWDVSLQLLVVFLVADYFTGVLAAMKQKRLDSDVMFWGGVRKAAILLVLILSIILDNMVHNSVPMFRTLVLYFYIAREGLSVFENIGLLGIAYPAFITDMLSQLKPPSVAPIQPTPTQETAAAQELPKGGGLK